MAIDRRTVLTSGLVGSALMAATAAGAQPLTAPVIVPAPGPLAPELIKLWPGEAPGGAGVTAAYQETQTPDGWGMGRDILGVTEPLVTIHRVASSDTAILCIPGGGFTHEVFDKEGEEVCRWLNRQGISPGSLVYRLPGDGWTAKADAPVQDAKRALRLLARASGAKRIGVMGFSAGGTIAAAVATRWDEPLYTAVDEADQIDARPQFMALGYPYLNLPATLGGQVSMYHGMTAASPPAFFFLAIDDQRVTIDNSIEAAKALHDLKIPAALHMFERGGHGFALRSPAGASSSQWPSLFLAWAKAGGFIAA